jgi:hypothetical protein
MNDMRNLQHIKTHNFATTVFFPSYIEKLLDKKNGIKKFY